MKRIFTTIASTLMMALSLGMAGCGASTETSDEDGETVGETAQALVAHNFCVADTWNGNTLTAHVALVPTKVHSLDFYFAGVRFTNANNAYATLVHPDGSWVKFATTDNIPDRIRVRRDLHRVDSGGGVISSEAVGAGDVWRVELIFDLPNASDRRCRTFVAR